jgi:hypothetical protein
MMFTSSNSNAVSDALSSHPIGHPVEIPRCDRWRIYQRLQELMIPCSCPSDGSLRVEVNHCIAAVLLRSTVQQFTAPREDLVDWLKRCWRTELREKVKDEG